MLIKDISKKRRSTKMEFLNLIGIATIPAVVSAFISGIITYFLSRQQNRKELEQIELEHKKQIENYHQQNIFDLKKQAILDSLSVIDLYLSWHIFNDTIVPVREETSAAALTIKVRECFNNLCVTCNNNDLILLYGRLFFEREDNVVDLYSEYRNEARKELGLNKINFNQDIIFLSKVSTEDLDRATQ